MKSIMIPSKRVFILFLTLALMTWVALPAFTASASIAASTSTQPDSQPSSVGAALSFSTYLGSNSARGVATDAAGNIYITGEVRSTGIAVTMGAAQTSFGGGDGDAFVIKLNPTGDQIIYATYIGGSGYDAGAGIAVDAAGAAYVTGVAGRNFPTTAGALKRSLTGSSTEADAFVAKLNPAGSALIYSTYLGGTASEGANGIAIDGAGNAYVTGSTSSIDFPTTEGAFLRIRHAFGSDVFVTKLNASGSNIVYSTFFGGSNIDTAGGIAVDSSGNAYITGITSSVDMPVPRAFQRTNGGGPTFKTTNAAQDWSLINAGFSAAFVWDLTVDPSNTAILYASTSEGIFKSTDGGATWSALNEGLTNFEASSLAIDPVTPATLYAAARNGVFKSTDGGATWGLSFSLSGLLAYVVEIDPMNPSVVYAGARDAQGGLVAKSTNGGATWSFTRLLANDPFSTINTLAIDPLNTSTIYVGTSRTGGVYGTVFKSTDAGRSWTNTLLTVVDVYEIAVAPNAQATVYAATGEGAYRSDDGGAHWAEINSWPGGYPASIVVDPANPSILYAGVEVASRGGVYKSTNGGATWEATSLTNVSARAIAIDPRNSSNLYAATTVASDAFVAKFNSTGSALFYSTYLGGIADEAIFGISLAIDVAGNAYVAGTTQSANFPTINALKSNFSGQFSDAFAAKIASFNVSSAPIITAVRVSGKKLIVSGENFSDRAAIVLGVESQKTANDEAKPNDRLIGKKAGKKIARGQTISIQVRNSDGTLSEPFTFTRPVE